MRFLIRTALLALAFAFGALLVPTVASAMPIHFSFVNERGETIVAEPVYPGCSVGKTAVETGTTLNVTCEVAANKQTGIQVRVPGGAGVICYPYVAVMGEYRIEASQIGTVSCAMTTVGRGSYKLYFARAAFLRIELKNTRSDALIATMTNYNCKPHDSQMHVGAGGTLNFTCFREDMASGQGITIQARVPNTTRDLICQGWWHENKTLVFYGNCSIEHRGGDNYVFTIR